jgi:hypothetical protein
MHVNLVEKIQELMNDQIISFKCNYENELIKRKGTSLLKACKYNLPRALQTEPIVAQTSSKARVIWHTVQ